MDNKPKFVAPSSMLWRGYTGTWKVTKDKLYLVDLIAHTEPDLRKGIDYIFPNQKEVFAEWFSGIIVIPQGELLKYIHGGYASIYEEDVKLSFEKGVMVGTEIIDHRNNIHLLEDDNNLPF